MAIALQLEPKIIDRLISKSEIKNIEKLTKEIQDFCDRSTIEEFYIFGSVLRDDFRFNSDIDVLVKFSANAKCGLMEIVRMQEDLEIIFGRKIDLLTKASIEESHNWIRRKEILSTVRLIYVKR
jgi:uncharacterized protein